MELNYFDEGRQYKYKTGRAASILNVSETTIKRYIEELGLDIEYQASGAVKSRVLYEKDLFEIAQKKLGRESKDKKSGPIVIMVWIERGGNGKSTLTRELSCILQARGLKVLCKDWDPQNTLTSMFGYNSEIDQSVVDEYPEAEIQPYQVIRYDMSDFFRAATERNYGEKPKLSDALKKPFGEYGPHLLPGTTALAGMPGSNNPSGSLAMVMNKALGRTGKPDENFDLSVYDIIFVDCNPIRTRSLEELSYVADYMLCPAVTTGFSTRSVSQSIEFTEASVAIAGKPAPEPIIVPNRFKKNIPRCQKNLAKLQERYGDMVLGSTVRQADDFEKTLEEESFGPLFLSNLSSLARSDLLSVADDLLEKIKIKSK